MSVRLNDCRLALSQQGLSDTISTSTWQSYAWCATGWIVLLAMLNGCTTLGLSKKDDEYDLAKRAIESYEDGEGNYIRPEGVRADKQKKSDLPKFMQSIPGLGPKPKNPELAKTLFDDGQRLFNEAKSMEGDERSKKFVEAAKKFKEAGDNWVSSYLQQDAMLMEAESYFFAEEYPKAENRYVKLLKEYPRPKRQDHIDKRRMEIGNYWLQFPDKFYHINFTDRKRPWNDTGKHGVRVLEKLRLDSPTGKLADDVTMELANTAFKNEKWTEALDTYRDLITAYPDSRHQFDAHFFGLKAALLAYRGPDYSQEPLLAAEKLLKQMRQFPEDYRREKEFIDQAYTELMNRKAERRYHLAVFRYNKGEAKAARMYCEEILKEYENTAYSEPAKELMGTLQEMPDEPTPHLKWLGDFFPDRDKTTPLLKPLPAEAVSPEKQDEIERTARGPEATPSNGYGSVGNR